MRLAVNLQLVKLGIVWSCFRCLVFSEWLDFAASMADFERDSTAEMDSEQAIMSLKKGTYLLKYGRKGKPKFCPFQLSNDETLLIWYSGKEKKQLKLSHVSRIIPGQRTAIFQRYPRPEKEYQSFSLIYNDRSLDLICKDKDEAEVWFVALRALISQSNSRKWGSDPGSCSVSSESQYSHSHRHSPSYVSWSSNDMINKDPGDSQTYENSPQNSLAEAFSDVSSDNAAAKAYTRADSVARSLSLLTSERLDDRNSRNSAVDTFRISLSSAISSSSQGSAREDFDALCDVFIWGEGIGDGPLGGSVHGDGSFSSVRMDAHRPMALESTVVLRAQSIACGNKHAVLVTKQGEIYSWGEGSGGRLGHGMESDVSHPKIINALRWSNIELVACGEYHTCAVTLSGDLYTWGDGIHNLGLLGHGSEVSHWIPKKVSGQIEGLHVSLISCGPWHTAAVTTEGKLFTFGDGTFGALGHGDRNSTCVPREVEKLKSLRTLRASCGAWHTAAVVEVTNEPSCSGSSSAGMLFTWGDGDKGQLGHGDKDPRLAPSCVAVPDDTSFCQVACGHSITIALTASGQLYAMGSADYGQLGNPESVGKLPTCIGGKLKNSYIEEIACGSHHVAVLSSNSEVYTWGKGANGQLGHGDNGDRTIPTLVEGLKDRQVKSVMCGSNYTAAVCLHKWAAGTDRSKCSGCHSSFSFRRKRHHCYNCGLAFCRSCSSKKSLKASLAPNTNKPYHVCDDCFAKLKKAMAMESRSISQIPKIPSANMLPEKETLNPKLRRLSRLFSFDSAKQAETKHEKTLELNNGNVSTISNENSQWGSFYTPRMSNSIFGDSKKISASVPGSRIVSRATSPVSRKSSPSLSMASRKSSPSLSMTRTSASTDLAHPEVILDNSKQINDNLSQEIVILRDQVEDLTRKTQLLEAELERTSRQLKETTVTAREEAEKNKAAKEVIRSLTAQLKGMDETAPEDSTKSHFHLTSPSSIEHLSSDNIADPILSNGSKEISEKVEWVVKDEPGVYITLSSLPAGGNYFRQVQFSRKHFSKEEAEKWWIENKIKVFERHNIQNRS